MDISMFGLANIIIAGFLILLALVGLCFFQFFLAKRENKWLGIILPVVFFIMSISFTSENMFNIYRLEYNNGFIGSGPFIGALIGFIVLNIPTLITLVIYLIAQKKVKKNKELEKMNIQDLE